MRILVILIFAVVAMAGLWILTSAMTTDDDRKTMAELNRRLGPECVFALSKFRNFIQVNVASGIIETDEALRLAKSYWFEGDDLRRNVGRHRTIAFYSADGKSLLLNVSLGFRDNMPTLVAFTVSGTGILQKSNWSILKTCSSSEIRAK